MSVADLEDDFSYMCEVMSQTRPTAVNLFWAIERMRNRFNQEKSRTKNVEEIKDRLVKEALKIFEEDIEANRSIGSYGAELIPDGATVLTHCNAGALGPMKRRTRSCLSPAMLRARAKPSRIAVSAVRPS